MSEYSYEIDKYIVGVDNNGEDGIGLTIATMKDNELHILGSCYGDNARFIDLLIKENQSLKNQLENCYCNRTDCAGRIKDSKKYDSLVQKYENQQKKFIEYLENEKDRLVRECSHIYEDSLGKTRLVNEDIFNEVDKNLSKYKEIIGDDK